MEFVNVRDLRVNTGVVWDKLALEKDLIITSNGKPIALMTGIDGRSLEATLASVRRGRAEWAIREMRRSAQKREISEEEIDGEIKKVRQLRKKKK